MADTKQSRIISVPEVLPVLPLRDTVIFPRAIAPSASIARAWRRASYLRSSAARLGLVASEEEVISAALGLTAPTEQAA